MLKIRGEKKKKEILAETKANINEETKPKRKKTSEIYSFCIAHEAVALFDVTGPIGALDVLKPVPSLSTGRLAEAKERTEVLIALGPRAPCHLEERAQLLAAASLSPARAWGAASACGHVKHTRETKRTSIRNFLTGL